MVTKQRARDTLEIKADSSDSATSSQGFMLQPPCRRLYFSSCSRTDQSGRGAAGATFKMEAQGCASLLNMRHMQSRKQ